MRELKSVEELREKGRVRQRRWRKRHRGYARERERNAKREERAKRRGPNKGKSVPNGGKGEMGMVYKEEVGPWRVGVMREEGVVEVEMG
jgi:hypothetical protein